MSTRFWCAGPVLVGRQEPLMGDYSRSDVVTCLYSLVVHKEALFGQYEVLVGC